MPRRCYSLLLRAASVGAIAFMLAACSKGGQFDPTTLLDNNMFNTKTRLKGKREPVFPNGVPGVATGIPPDLVKGYQPPPEQTAGGDADMNGAAPSPGAAVDIKPKPKPRRRPKLARARRRRQRTTVTAGVKRRRRHSRQPRSPKSGSPQPVQKAQSIWPPPPSAGTVQQASQPSSSIWPNPPAPATQ